MSRAWPVKGIDPDASLADNARRILTVRMGEFYSYDPVVPIEAAIEPLHNLRIAAKRLRYTLELFEVVFGDLGQRQIERVKAIQEDLGTLRDFDVRIHLVEDELHTLSDEENTASNGDTDANAQPAPSNVRRGLQTLLDHEHEARHDRFRAFVARWDELREEGMRGDLARLSTPPSVAAPEKPAPRPQAIADSDVDDRVQGGNGGVAEVQVEVETTAEPNRYRAAF